MVNYITLPALAACLLVACNQPHETPNVATAIIPKPNELLQKQGAFVIDAQTKLVFNNEQALFSQTIQDYLEALTAFDLKTSPEPSPNSISFSIDKNKNPEEYAIVSSPEQIAITGGDEVALMHGFQTLRQILLEQDGTFIIPAMEIKDKPRFPWRGLLLDCGRHFMEKDFVKRYIDLLALYKMNRLHWHLTEDQGWRIEIKKYPELTEIGAWRDDGHGGKYGGFYTQEDIKEVVAYAQARGITVVPEIELPGHSVAALAAYPQFSCTGGPFDVETNWGVFKDIYCAGNDSTFIFLEDVLSEVIDLFPSKYIHIGGDEAPKTRWEQCPKCQHRIQEEGLKNEHELQTYFVNRIGKFLRSKGKEMIGWDEILEGGLPEGAIVQSWRGFEGAQEAVSLGTKTIVSPTSHAYFDYPLNNIDMEKVYSFNPVPEGTTPEQEALILGGECNMWTEYAPQAKIDSKLFPRIMAMSEVLWSDTTDRDFQEFRKRVSAQYKVLDKLGVSYGFETVPAEVGTEVANGRLKAVLTSYDSTFSLSYFDGTAHHYDKPVTLEKPTEWAITFSRGGNTFKDTIYQRFHPHIANGLVPELKHKFAKKYSAGGVAALTDGKKGSLRLNDGNWQGYWGTDVDATIDLGAVKQVSILSSGFLHKVSSWIFFPKKVAYSYSEDGKNFTEAGAIDNTISIKNNQQIHQEYTLALDRPVSARYVKMHAYSIGKCPAWHDGAGSNSWLFVDEFSIE